MPLSLKSIIFGFCISFFTAVQATPIWPSLNIAQYVKQSRPVSHRVIIPHDPVFQSEKHYQAYALRDLILALSKQYSQPLQQALLVFTARDGYQISLPYLDAIKELGYVAYKDLDAESTWLNFNVGNQALSPAPYYLVWKNSQLSEWQYPWPYQLTDIALQPLQEYFAKVVPQTQSPHINAGFNDYVRYCIRCHTINNTGGEMGPALDNSLSARFAMDQLHAIISNAPAYFTDTKMPTFKEQLTTQQIHSIIKYLQSIDPK